MIEKEAKLGSSQNCLSKSNRKPLNKEIDVLFKINESTNIIGKLTDTTIDIINNGNSYYEKNLYLLLKERYWTIHMAENKSIHLS